MSYSSIEGNTAPNYERLYLFRPFLDSLLIDARRGIAPVDDEFMAFLDQLDVLFQMIRTKVDVVVVIEPEGRYIKI